MWRTAATVLLLACGLTAWGGEPAPPPAADIPVWDTKQKADPAGLSAIEKRLLAIRMPVVDFQKVHVSKVVEFLDRCVKEQGGPGEQDDKSRVRLEYQGTLDNSDHDGMITLRWREVPLYHALKALCKLAAGFEYRVDGNTVIVRPTAD